MKITILNQKGGVGKSTAAVNVSYGLSLKRKQTLLIDLDPQAHSSVIFAQNGVQARTVGDLLLKKSSSVRQVVQQACLENGELVDNLFIIPSNIHLAITAEQVATKIHREKLLHNHLKKIEAEYDYIIIDCPPSINVLTINAIYTADLIIIPTTYGRYSLDGIADLFQSIEDVKETKKFAYRILRTSRDSRNKLSNRYVDEQLEPFKDHLFETTIRRNEAINQAQMNGEPVQVFDSRSNGAADFNKLVKEVICYG